MLFVVVQIRQRTPRYLIKIYSQKPVNTGLKIRVSVVRFRPWPPHGLLSFSGEGTVEQWRHAAVE